MAVGATGSGATAAGGGTVGAGGTAAVGAAAGGGGATAMIAGGLPGHSQASTASAAKPRAAKAMPRDARRGGGALGGGVAMRGVLRGRGAA